MTDYIVCFDTETTGLDPQRDYIIQLSLVKFDAHTFEEIDALDWYILPSAAFTISPEAEAVHHISREQLEQQGVSLRAIFPQFKAFVKGCDFLSYNGNAFDIRILYANFLREGLTFDFDQHTFYDALTIETARTSRRLADTYRRYYGEDFQDAHNALADVRATIAVFKAQTETAKEAKEIQRPEFDFVSLDGFLTLRPTTSSTPPTTSPNHTIVMAQGKYKGFTVAQIQQEAPSYLDWVCSTCAEPTKQQITILRQPNTPQDLTAFTPTPTIAETSKQPRKNKTTQPSTQLDLFAFE